MGIKKEEVWGKINMKYFLFMSQEGNKIPQKINCNRGIDIRYIHEDKASKLPLWNLVEMESQAEMIFPDILDSPFFVVSRKFFGVVQLYVPNIKYKCINLFCKKDGKNELYFLPIFKEIECLSEKSEFNLNKSIIKKIILDEAIIKDEAIFRIAGFDKSYVIGRLDFVESVLRRGLYGIKLCELEVR